MPFCHSPWTNLDIDPLGTMAPCCKFQHDKKEEKFNIRTHTIQQYSKSNLLLQVRNQFMQGNWPSGCERCQIEEQNNIESKRNLDHTRWKDHYAQYNLDSNQFITASVAFGNTCNLKCITCGPTSSSKWQKEHKTIYGIDIANNKFYKNNFVKDLLQAAPSLVHLDIPGGEPLLSGVAQQKEMLQYYVDTEQAANMSLHYTTNVTLFPDEEWRMLWQHFKNVDIQLSIDGIGKRQEYIRYPAVWKDILNNTDRYVAYAAKNNNLQLSVSHTISAYNIYYLDEFFTWCQQIGLPRPWLGKVHKPKFMRPTVWPQFAREYIVKHLLSSQHADVYTWATMLEQIDDSKYFDDFKRLTQQHDQYRGLEFGSTFKEMSNWIK